VERTDLIAYESIRDLLGLYTWSGDRGDAAGVADLFTADGVLDVGDHGGRWEGQQAIADNLEAVAARIAAAAGAPGRVQHHVSSVSIDLDHHDSATVRSYFLVLTATGPDHWGRYRDRVVETAPGGRWLFAERVVRVDGHVPGSVFVPDGSAEPA
jgi:uncharacterized protein (TIGR02246 family)